MRQLVLELRYLGAQALGECTNTDLQPDAALIPYNGDPLRTERRQVDLVLGTVYPKMFCIEAMR